VQSQWRMGMAGPTGLDYGGVESALRMAGTPRREWPQLFGDLQVMEGTWMDEVRRRR